MRAWIKSGLLIGLGLLAQRAGAQESSWKSSPPFPQVTLSQPTPLEGPAPQPPAGPASFRIISNAPRPTVRAQQADERIFQIEPLLFPQETQPPQQLPKDNGSPAPKGNGGPGPKTDSFVPPPPQPLTTMTPSPIYDSIGMGCDCSCAQSYPSCSSCSSCSSCQSCCPGILGGMMGDGMGPDRGRFWASAETLLWFIRPDHVPPLVSSSTTPVPASGVTNAGGVGQPGTSVLYDSIPDNLRVGGRFDVGVWFARCPNLGFEVNFFTLGREVDSSTFGSGGDPALYRPFTDANTGVNRGEFVAVPGFVSGSATVNHYSELWGIEGLLRYQLWRCCNGWVDLTFGYRSLSLSEGIDISEALTVAPAFGGGNIGVQDSFHTRNEFNGAQVGIDGQWYFAPRWSIGGSFKLAMGSTYEVIDINGSTTTAAGTFPGGLLALQNTNIGHYTQNRFAVLPEAAFRIGWDVTPRLQLFVAYDFIDLSDVVRPGSQINPNVNPNFQPTGVPGFPPSMVGPRQPAPTFATSNFWAQGVNLGLLYRF